MMTVEEKPDVTYADIGGCKEQIERMREVVELPMLHPERFVALGIDPPKGVLCYGPPGAHHPPRLHLPTQSADFDRRDDVQWISEYCPSSAGF